MVQWIGHFSLLLKRLKENADRLTRCETALDPNTLETRERWNTAQVNNHESLCSLSDNLTTLTFIVASDLSEALRERLASALSLRTLEITACTLETARTMFAELFCTPKNLMENPSLRVSGNVNSTHRSFNVEDHAEDECGQWTKDEVTAERGYVVDNERSCFWTWDDTECVWQSRPFKGRQIRRRKRKGKGKGQRTIQKDRKSILW